MIILIDYPASVSLRLQQSSTRLTVNTAGLNWQTLMDGVSSALQDQQPQPKVSLTSQFDCCELTASPCLSVSRPP